MQIVNNKALHLKVRNADRFNVIPHKHVEPIPGGYNVYVKWGLDEVRVLRNLGIADAPSPIRKDYGWPGRYKPMSHQIDTADFTTIHRRCFVLNDAGCVDADTEYLSPTGWKRIADYEGGDVAQYHPATGAAEFVAPTEFVKLPCTDMIRFKTKYGVDQLLSPEHRMVVRSAAADKWCVMQAADVLAAHDDFHAGVQRPNQRRAGSDTVSFNHAAIPSVFTMPDSVGIALSEATLRVQVAVIADGHIPNKTTTCTMRLKRARKIARLHTLLHAACIEYKVREQNTPTAKGFTIFTFKAPWHVKEFDARFWQATQAQRDIIGEEVLHWDGTQRDGNKGNSFSTTSRASADFIQFVWNTRGITARVTEDRRPKYKDGVCYTVQARGRKRATGLLKLGSRHAPTVTPAPSTDGFKYCFMVPSTYLLFRRNGCVFASGNTGKTLSALWAADYLMTLGHVRRVLIICPVSIMHSAWMNDFNRSVIHRSAVVAHHSDAKRRVEAVKQGYEFVIVNYDGVRLIGHAVRSDKRFDLIIVDEATAYSNAATDRWKALHSLLTPTTLLWMMTGTPAAQSPEQAYGLAKLVNPSSVPAYKGAWKDKVMLKVSTFKWVPRPNAKDLVHAVLQPAIRFSKKQCLDLPPVIVETRDVPMSAQQAKYYKLMKDQMVATAAGEKISAVNKGIMVGKLLQISAGSVRTDDGDVIEFDAAPRLNVLLEVVKEASNKFLVFAVNTAVINRLHEFLSKHGFNVAIIDGNVPQSKRNDIVNQFQHTDELDGLVMQPKTTAHGLTLTRADAVVFYGPMDSVEHYIQCIARSDRKGQVADKVTVTHIQNSPAERVAFQRLAGRVEESYQLSGMFDDVMAE